MREGGEMSKPVTVIISDLHLGGGINDRGDDHVYQGSPLVKLLERLCKENVKIELFINGDLFELAQVSPELYQGGDFSSWSSEDESLARLEIIINGHKDIFTALNNFLENGNRITIAAGNHDVDLYWPKVQKRIIEEIGDTQFELGQTWYSRFNGKLQISHGHMEDPANRFDRWQDPILRPEFEIPRLEMCPGTLFMLKIVNILENDYPFIDNIKPVTALAPILWKSDKTEFSSVAWLLFKFSVLHPGVALHVDFAEMDDFFSKLNMYARPGTPLFETISQIAHKTYVEIQTDEEVLSHLKTESNLCTFLEDVLTKLGMDELKKINPIGADMAIREAGNIDEKKHLQEVAKLFFQRCPTCELIVMGHTHQPDEQIFTINQIERRYYNPGSWTRYADISQYDSLTLDKLKDESIYPYQLNFVWVEESENGILISRMENLDLYLAKPF